MEQFPSSAALSLVERSATFPNMDCFPFEWLNCSDIKSYQILLMSFKARRGRLLLRQSSIDPSVDPSIDPLYTGSWLKIPPVKLQWFAAYSSFQVPTLQYGWWRWQALLFFVCCETQSTLTFQQSIGWVTLSSIARLFVPLSISPALVTSPLIRHYIFFKNYTNTFSKKKYFTWGKRINCDIFFQNLEFEQIYLKNWNIILIFIYNCSYYSQSLAEIAKHF